MQGNLKSRRVWWIAAVIVAIAIISLVAWRTRLSADEQLEQEAVEAAKRWTMSRTGKFWKSPGLVIDGILGKATETRYLAIYHHAETNLLQKGYLVKQRFRFEHGTHSWKAFSDALDKRLGWDNGMWSCTYLTQSMVEVVVRSNALPRWEALVREFDQPPQK